MCDSAGVIHGSSARVCMRYAYMFRVLCVDVARCSLFNFMIYLFQRETIYYYNQAFKSQHGNTVFESWRSWPSPCSTRSTGVSWCARVDRES